MKFESMLDIGSRDLCKYGFKEELRRPSEYGRMRSPAAQGCRSRSGADRLTAKTVPSRLGFVQRKAVVCTRQICLGSGRRREDQAVELSLWL